MNGYPLKREELKGEFEETVVTTILHQTGELQKAVYNVSVFYICCFFILSYFVILFNQDCRAITLEVEGTTSQSNCSLKMAIVHSGLIRFRKEVVLHLLKETYEI